MTLEEARRTLRVDQDDETDLIVQSLLDAVPDYIEMTTGMKEEQQAVCRLCDTVAGFLLRLWYYPEGADSERLQRVADNLLKAITTLARSEGE